MDRRRRKFFEAICAELSIYVRQCAWLDAVPEAVERKIRLADREHAPEKRLSRKAKMLQDNAPIPLPYLDSTYVPDLLFDVGPVSSGAMGATPISHGDIRCWMDNNGVDLPPWVCSMLRRLSHDYLAESQLSEKPDRPAPWTEESATDRRERTAAQVRGALRVFK